ncbi:MAG: DNA polymerase III subunit gamma/tau [Candidatus Acidiferrales bacterium]
MSSLDRVPGPSEMTYQVIARKYRPQTFDEIIGQEPIVRTLKNAIEQNLVAHAYIFSGMRGVGKTTTARILAKGLNCEKGPTVKPCGQCPACREITSGTAIDVLEVDAASTGRVEEIRQLLETARYVPARDPYKVFIIDEAHMLSTAACNALLKTLEEPPPRVLFVLATTEPQRIIPTIHSRCQSFHFRSISFQEILELLGRVAAQEGAQVEPEALAVMTRAAEGSLRDALSVLDQAIAYGGKTITAAQARELLGVVGDEVLDELVVAIADASSEKILRLVDHLEREGHNLQHFCREALRHIRNLLLVRIGGAAAKLAEAAGLERQRLEAAASRFSEEDLLRFFKVLLDTERDLRWAPQPRLHLELGLLKLAQAERLIPLEEVLAELTGTSLPARPPAGNPASAPAPGVSPSPVLRGPQEAGGPTLESETIEAIQSAVFAQSKFLGSFVESVARWERQHDSLTLWFPANSRTLVEMLDKHQQTQLEKIIAGVLAAPVKVYAKVGAVEPACPVAAVADNPHNPVVKALLDRFGGSVRRASELTARRRPEEK